MTQCEDVQPTLSGFIDHTLDPELEAAVVRHLEVCPSCRGVREDLARISTAARSLGPMSPPDHLWLEIAGQLQLADTSAPEPDTPRAEPSAALQWLGLAAALVLITLGAYVVSSVVDPAGNEADSNAADAGSVQTVTTELDLAMEHYENAIAELEVMATSGDDSLAPETAATLRENITIIDAAIVESRSALSTNPTNQPARASLLEALSKKVSLLQATAALMNRMRQGDPEGAAAAAGTIGKKS